MFLRFHLFLTIISCVQALGLTSQIQAIKQKLLSLDRKTLIIPNKEIKQYVSLLEQENPTILKFPDLWKQLEGKWLLKYTNNASDYQNLQKNTPLSSVEQNIEINADDSKNIYHVLTFDNAQPIQIILKHSAKATSKSIPAQIALDLDQFEFKCGSLHFKSPPLLAPAILRRGFFDTTYVDDELRISRGLFGEIRIFQRL